jgi:hypothetical protein
MKKWEMAKALLKTGSLDLEVEKKYNKYRFFAFLMRIIQGIIVLMALGSMVLEFVGGFAFLKLDTFRGTLGAVLTFFMVPLTGLVYFFLLIYLQSFFDSHKDECDRLRYQLIEGKRL